MKKTPQNDKIKELCQKKNINLILKAMSKHIVCGTNYFIIGEDNTLFIMFSINCKQRQKYNKKQCRIKIRGIENTIISLGKTFDVKFEFNCDSLTQGMYHLSAKLRKEKKDI